MAPWVKGITILLISLLEVWSSSSALPSDQKSWIVRRQINNPTEIVPEFEKPAAKSSRIYSMDIVSDIRLRYSSTKVTTRMANPSTSQSQETTFHVVLPDTAFISGFLMDIDGKEYKASVKEKEEAKAVYEAAVSSGQTAAQVSSSARDANQFTVSINIEAGAKISFNLTYEELLTRRRGVYEQAIHINPGSIVERLSVNVNLFEVLPITTIRIPRLRENDIQDTDDSTNELAKIVRHNETAVSIIYEPDETEQKKSSSNGLKGQFVIQYDIDRSSLERKGGEIHVVDGYFVHFFAPTTLSILPKHVVFVLDTSGSMQGIRLEQTKQAMVSILDQLRAEDIFSVVEFSSEIKEWDLTKDYKGPEPGYYWPQPSEQTTTDTNVKVPEEKKSFGSFDDIFAYQVTNASVLRAKEFVNKMEAGGSTNINGALLVALNNTQSVNARVRLTPMIIFLTDGEATVGVTNNNDILTNLRKANSDGVVSIFSLAFGTGADYKFLTKVSTEHRGFSRKIYEAADATIQLKGFFDEVASPLLSNVRFVYKDGEKGIEEITKTKVENYFKGSEFVVAGRLTPSSIAPSSAELFTVGVNGTAADGPYIINYPILPSPGDPPSSDNKKEKVKNSKGSSTKFSLEKIWAYLTIQDMLKNREQDDVTKEQKTNASEKALRLSLKYGFVTPVTSLVVVKPNETLTTDIRPAEPQSVAGDVSYQNYASHFSSGGAAYAGIAPAHAFGVSYPLSAFRPSGFFPAPPPAPFGLTTTTRYPSNTQLTHAPGLEAEEELDGGYEQESSSSLPESVEQTEVPSIFDPKKWIDLFPHNETHASIEFANQTLSLSWEDVLPDQDYDPCKLTKDDVRRGFCKSIWKCASFANEENLNSNSKCVIQNKFVGICCASSAKVTESSVTAVPADAIKG